MAYILDIPGTDLTLWSTLPRYALGTKGHGVDGDYQYVSSIVATIPVASLVVIDHAYAVTVGDSDTNLASGAVVKLGVVTTAIPAGTSDEQYGWVFVGPGTVSVLCATDCAQDVQLYATSVAGVVDDAVANAPIVGLKLITTITTAAASSCFATKELSATN
jgi:hypothetical protein